MNEKTLELKPCPFCGEQPSILKNMGTIFCGNGECFGPTATAECLEDSAVQWNTRASSSAQEPVTTEPMSPAMIALNSEPYNRGYIDGWATAHEPAPCGHSRANWKDPKFGTPEYRGEEKCEICAALTILAPPQSGREWLPISGMEWPAMPVMLGFWYQGSFKQYIAEHDPAGWMEQGKRTFYPSHMQGWFTHWRPLPTPPSLPETQNEPRSIPTYSNNDGSVSCPSCGHPCEWTPIDPGGYAPEKFGGWYCKRCDVFAETDVE